MLGPCGHELTVGINSLFNIRMRMGTVPHWLMCLRSAAWEDCRAFRMESLMEEVGSWGCTLSFSDRASLPVHGCNGIIGPLSFLCLSYHSGLCTLKLWARINESFLKQLPIFGDRNKKGTPTLQQLSLATMAGSLVDDMQVYSCFYNNVWWVRLGMYVGYNLSWSRATELQK